MRLYRQLSGEPVQGKSDKIFGLIRDAGRRVALPGCLVVLCIASGSCANPTVPPPPSPVASTTPVNNSGNLNNEQSGNGGNSEASGSEASGSEGSGSSSYVRGGALVGTSDDQKAVKTCLDAGTFYDRFGNQGAGVCTQVALAPLDCTQGGIETAVGSSLKAQFDSLLSGSTYQGWSIDQCIYCAPNGSSQCTSSSGASQSGLKVFFVEQQGNTVKGQSMLIPWKPPGS